MGPETYPDQVSTTSGCSSSMSKVGMVGHIRWGVKQGSLAVSVRSTSDGGFPVFLRFYMSGQISV